MNIEEVFEGLFMAYGFPMVEEKPEPLVSDKVTTNDISEAEAALIEAINRLKNLKTKKVTDIIKAMDEAKIEDNVEEEKTAVVVGDLSSTIASAVTEGITSMIRSGALTDELRKALGMDAGVPAVVVNEPKTTNGARNIKEAEVPVTPKATSAKVPPKAKTPKAPAAV